MIQRVGGKIKNSPNQEKLNQVLKELFPEQNILHNVRKGSQIISPVTGYHLELDAWIPDINIAFEYQDPHHYVSTWYENSPLDQVKFRDEWKKKEIEKLGVTLIEVPCWWDGDKDSLVSTIKTIKPKLLPHFLSSSPPIPDVPPDGYFNTLEIPGIGQPMLASFAESSQIMPVNWWVSEKYDGVRAFWNPSEQNLYSRYTKVFSVSPSIKNLFPKYVFLDGELWAGRGTFDNTQKNFRFFQRHQWWEGGRMIALDNPSQVDHSLSFESRFYMLFINISSDHPFLLLTSNLKSKSKVQIEEKMREVIAAEGEGLIIRQHKSVYVQGRSNFLLKFKATRDDEGMVLDRTKNRNYLLQLKGGDIIKVQGNTEEEFDVGDVVTFNYAGSNRPVIVRKRVDLDWNNVNSPSPSLDSDSKNINLVFANPPSRHPRGYWTVDGNINIRNFFDNFARSKNLDPLNPETWYSIPLGTFRHLPEWPLHHYSSNSVRALIDTYPDIGLDESKFPSARRNHWAVTRNRRLFFDKFAAGHQFNPLDPSAWYHITMKAIMSQKGGDALLEQCNRSLVKALQDAYPELLFDPSQFKPLHNKTMPSYWRLAIHRKRFFDVVAKKRGFDPLVAGNWYNINYEVIKSEHGAVALMDYYKNSFSSALVDVYPEVKFDWTRFAVPKSPKNFVKY